MAEYQILNLMQVGFIQNAMYFVGMVLFTWLGFRMANNVYNNADANMLSKVLTSVFCIFVAAFMFGVNQIGGSILESAVMQLNEVGASSAERMAEYLDFPLVVGSPLQTAFVLFILAFQLAITWSSK
tara:strand:- start:610 stop:990 length:381 start_codon:yes stop_codon:yes gene_type:complete